MRVAVFPEIYERKGATRLALGIFVLFVSFVVMDSV
jgi:hypothetical protein